MFQPLKEYFETSTNSPRKIKDFFTVDSSLFWLKFLESQLEISNSYVLKVESKGAAAFEVASELADLRGVIKTRQDANRIPYEANLLFKDLSEIKKADIKQDVQLFYSSLSNYLEKWSKSLDGAETFAWMKLNSVPNFEKEVEPAATFILHHHPSADLEIERLFDEFPLVKQYIDGALASWVSKKVSIEQRWLETLKSLAEQHHPTPNFSLLVQYALAIPGSSAEVERLFSIIKDVWGPNKGQLEAKTLEAHLDVKFNCNKTCQEFYKEAKNNKKLLAQVQSGDKYKSVPQNG